MNVTHVYHIFKERFMLENKLSYNYVISGSGDYFLVGYHDIMEMPNVKYASSVYDGINSFLGKNLIRLNFSRKINSVIKNPFSKIVNPILYPHDFPVDKPICYIFFATSCDVFQSNYIDYLRKKYKHIKLVLYMQDLVSMVRFFDFNQALKTMDLVLTYDKGDSIKYNLPYHPTPMSFVEVPIDENLANSDVYYCGVAKTRYKKIHSLYEKFVSAGLKCDFNLMSMPEGAPRIEGINYPSYFFSYKENLQHIQKTSCIIEIMQEGATGFTPRLWESIVYDKHLITNNKTVIDSPFYDKRGIHLVDEASETDFMNMIKQQVRYSTLLKDSLSPIHLLEFIDEQLRKQ